MYLTEGETEKIPLNPSYLFLLIIATLAILTFGVMPMIIKGLL